MIDISSTCGKWNFSFIDFDLFFSRRDLLVTIIGRGYRLQTGLGDSVILLPNGSSTFQSHPTMLLTDRIQTLCYQIVASLNSRPAETY